MCVCVWGGDGSNDSTRAVTPAHVSVRSALKDKPVSCKNVVCLHNLNPLFASPGGCLAPSITMQVHIMQVDAENAGILFFFFNRNGTEIPPNHS